MSGVDRRRFVQAASVGAFGAIAAGWQSTLANKLVEEKKSRHVILLWMVGGPTQTDTFDMKPGHANGGQFKEIETKVPGLRFSEHLPKLAAMSDQLAVMRGLSTKEGDHGRGTYLMRTGHQPMGPVQYPTIGSSLSKHLAVEDSDMPSFVSISPFRQFNQAAYGPGFLGPKFAPLTVADSANGVTDAPVNGFAELRVDDLTPANGVKPTQVDARRRIWEKMENQFVAKHPSSATLAHQTVYQRAIRLMQSAAADCFDLTKEPANVREAYGKGRFGQGCLMARRLIEKGVSFVEVSLGGNGIGWDTHANNFEQVKTLSGELDAGWSMLMKDLADRGLLETTTILWMGEFGRTPKINPQGGRDHFPAAWTTVLAGGGIKGGQAFGKTDAAGETVEEGKIDVPDLLATLCKAAKVDPSEENISEVGRPIKLAEGTPVAQVLS